MVRSAAALLVATLLALASTGIASAQSSAEREAAAEVLFEEGRQLMSEGRYAEACPKFAESHRVDPGVGVLLFLADCYEKNGQTASAWATFRAVVPLARAAGQSERVETAMERTEALEGRLAKLEIVVTATTNNLVVLRDGIAVDRALWGTPVAVDPGRRSIEARAPGHQPFRVTVDVPSEPTVVRVEVPALVAESSAEQTPTTEPPPRPKKTPERVKVPLHPDAPPAHPDRTLSLVAGSIGVAGIVVGAVFGLKAKADWDEAMEHCSGSPRRCDDKGLELGDAAERSATISTIAFAVGAAGLGTAAVLWIVAPDPTASSRGAMVGVSGRF